MVGGATKVGKTFDLKYMNLFILKETNEYFSLKRSPNIRNYCHCMTGLVKGLVYIVGGATKVVNLGYTNLFI